MARMLRKKKKWQTYTWATLQPLCISGVKEPIYLSAYFKQTIFFFRWNMEWKNRPGRKEMVLTFFIILMPELIRLTNPSTPPPPFHPPSSSPLLSLALLTQPSLPLLPKMVRTPGLFSNYAPTFSEKVIIIRDPFSFFCEKHKIIFVIVVPERRSRTKIMARCWSQVAPLLWMGRQVASINGITRGGVAFCTLRAQK